MAIINVMVRGLAPGVMSSSPAPMLKEDEDVLGPKRKPPSRAEVAEDAAYRMDGGGLGFPAVAFGRALMEATAKQQLKPSGKKRAVSVAGIIAGLWEIEPKDLTPLTRDGGPVRDYVMDVRTGINSNVRPPARIVLARPLVVAPWEARFQIIWYEDVSPPDLPDVLRKYLVQAGIRIGIGAFRPMVRGKPTGGWFGRFEVVEWKAE
jgi:hypothetical protein